MKLQNGGMKGGGEYARKRCACCVWDHADIVQLPTCIAGRIACKLRELFSFFLHANFNVDELYFSDYFVPHEYTQTNKYFNTWVSVSFGVAEITQQLPTWPEKRDRRPIVRREDR